LIVESILVWGTVARWLDLCALATLVGSLTFDVAVLPGPAMRPGLPVDSPALDRVRIRVRRLLMGALALLAAASAAELVARAQTMAGGSLGAAISALPLVIARTHFGVVWRVRFGALTLLAALCSSAARPLRIAALVSAIAVALTTVVSGHAADSGDLTLATLVDALHVVAAGVWTGGLACLSLGGGKSESSR